MKMIAYKGSEIELKKDLLTKEMQRLLSLGLLKEGTYFDKQVVEYILECPYEKDCWIFLGKFLNLKMQIESRGFYVSQKKIPPPDFRILKSTEVAEHSYKLLCKSMSINFKVNHVMNLHDTSTLTEKEKKIYNHVKNKAANVSMYQQKILLQDFN